MKKTIFALSLLLASSAHAILILPYGHWTLKKVACTEGSRATPGLTRASRLDMHLAEEGDFQIALLTRQGWSTARGTMTVDHANAELCLQTTDRSVSSKKISPVIEPAQICGHYRKPAKDALVVVFGSHWMGQSCPENESLELTYAEL